LNLPGPSRHQGRVRADTIATTLVALPTLFAWAGVTVFAIAVSIRGF
jgi:hypothetical protein